MRRYRFALAATMLSLFAITLVMGCGKGKKSTNPAVTALELNSGNLGPGGAYSHRFMTQGAYAYHCNFHPSLMTGNVVVADAAPLGDTLVIVDVPFGQFLFNPNAVTIHTGGKVTWTNSTTMTHTVTSD